MSSFPTYAGDMQFPGLTSVLETVQNQFWWGRPEQQVFLPAGISGAARDAGNTITSVLRGGLLMGRVTATKLYKEWNPTGTDGSEVIRGILVEPLSVVVNGTNQNKYTHIYVGGNILSNRIYVPGNATEGIVGDALEFEVLSQLSHLGIFDLHIGELRTMFGSFKPRYLTAAEIAADAVTVTTADHGRTFMMTGGDNNTTFTLPAAQKGLEFTFMANIATHNLVIALASGNIALPGNVGATAITFAPGESGTLLGISAGLYQLINYTQVDAT
jgi:hypothetical protein